MSKYTDFEYVRYHAGPGEEDFTAQIVECYKEIFGGAPWSEWLKCSVCSQRWGLEDAKEIVSMGYKHCGQGLVDYWQRPDVYDDIVKEIRRDNSSCWLALDGSKVIGFCWGYAMTTNGFSQKVGLDVDYSIIGIQDHQNAIVAHQDEVGVLVPYRGKKIAKQLVSLRNRDFLGMGLAHGVVRTREYPIPSVTYSWYITLGYQILARYPDPDGRVVMGVEFASLS